MLGVFPQEFFPRLTVTFVVCPGASKATVIEGRERLLDSQSLSGPIPQLVRDSVAAVARNMRVGAIIEGAFRRDVPDYPLAAVREAVTNALMHRDYSDLAKGTQVQLDIYVDRFEVLNPGGLYGTVTIDTLGKPGVSSAGATILGDHSAIGVCDVLEKCAQALVPRGTDSGLSQ